MSRPRETPDQAAARKLQQLINRQPEMALVGRLYRIALDASVDRDRLVLGVERAATAEVSTLPAGRPCLDGVTVTVDGPRLRALVARLAEVVTAGSGEASTRLTEAVRRGRLDLTDMLRAVVRADDTALDRWAATLDLPVRLLTMTVAAALPPILGAARARLTIAPDGWTDGSCPGCGAWPTLAVMEGLERTRWAACARCGASWRLPWLLCVYCANADHETLGYFHPEGNEAVRVATCDRCRGYLKTVTRLALPTQFEIAVDDLATLDLDLTALDRDWTRPEPPPPIDLSFTTTAPNWLTALTGRQRR